MTALEQGQLCFGTTTIPYRVERSIRRHTVTLAVDPKDGVVLKVPASLSAARLSAVVRSRARWILQRLLDFRTLGPTPSPHEFVSGETCLYLGRHYRLKIAPRPDLLIPSVSLRIPTLLVETPASLSANLRQSSIRKALTRWYRSKALVHLPERVALYAHRAGIQPPAVLIRDQQKRWGSCTRTGQLRFNWRILMAPLSLLDYVVAHELCHLQIHDHSSSFWKLLTTILPDYEPRRSRLRVEGACFQL